jgi:mono/diheme cytochrome c family protein
LLPTAGAQFAQDEKCTACHHVGGAANPVVQMRLTHGPEWLTSHVRDPEVIAPGLRTPPSGGMNDSQAKAIVSYMKKIGGGAVPPKVSPDVEAVAAIFGRNCATCHMIDGDGGSAAPDLSHEGTRHDAMWLKDWITDPETVDPGANMPPFGERLSDQQLTTIATYLSNRK